MAVEPRYLFAWDERKAAANLRNTACRLKPRRPYFADPRLVTVADLAHSQQEERWLSIGIGTTGMRLTVACLWDQSVSGLITIRLITARPATRNETTQYKEHQ